METSIPKGNFLPTFHDCVLQAANISESLVFQTVINSDDAQKILQNGNTRNRNMNLKRVKDLERALLENRWQRNGDAIRLSKEGVLLDGQHRLQAVVNTKIPIETVVFLNASDDIFKTIDIGKTRNANDFVAIAYPDIKYPAKVAATARQYLLYLDQIEGKGQNGIQASYSKKDVVIEFCSSKSTFDNQRILFFIDENPYFKEFITECAKQLSFKRPSIIDFSVYAMFKWHTDKIDKEKSETFWFYVISQDYDAKNPYRPTGLLVNYLQRTKASGKYKLVTNTLRHYSTIATAWNWYRNNQERKEFPYNFPKLVPFK